MVKILTLAKTTIIPIKTAINAPLLSELFVSLNFSVPIAVEELVTGAIVTVVNRRQIFLYYINEFERCYYFFFSVLLKEKLLCFFG